MTVSVAWDGNGRQYSANIGTDTVTVVKYSGSGGTPTAVAADGSIEGSTALNVKVNKQGVAMFVTLPSALNFTTTESGQLVYVWGNFLASSLLNTQAADGFGICMSSGTPTASNYSLWTFFGSDNYAGGWKRMIIDPTKTRSAGSGTFSTSNVTHIGVFADVGGTTARFDNLILDACDVGNGLIVTGTSTLGLVEELLANEATNRYGVISALNDSETAAQLAGTLTLGDNVGTAASTITDEDSKLFVAEPLYYTTSEIAAVPLDYTGVSVVGNGTGDTNVTIGQAVGTTTGRNGIALVGNSTYNVSFDRDDGAVEAADFYGCSLENLTGTLSLDGVHDFNGQTMSGCVGVSIANSSEVKNLTSVSSGQINLNSSAKLTDSIVINNTAASNVLTTNIDDITGCSFTSDGTGHAVEISSVGAGSATWDNTDSGYASVDGSTGNETLYVNVGSGTLNLTIASGATTPTIRTAGATVNIVANPVTVKATAVDSTGAAISGARVLLRASDGTGAFPFDDTVTISNSGTTATVTHTAHGMATNDYIQITQGNLTANRGVFQVTVTGANSYTYTMSSSPGSSPTGTIKATFVALTGTTNGSGILSTTRVYSVDQPVIGWTRKASGSPYLQQGLLTGTITTGGGFDGTAVMISDE